MNKNKQLIIAISGVKNSGKTTLIENIIPILTEKGFKVATIKHDGHDFEPDVKNTDTFRHKKSGAYGTGIFSNNRFMVNKDISVSESDLIDFFPEADIIFLEGFKNSDYRKIEIYRTVNSISPVCSKNVIAIITDDENCLEHNTNKFLLNEYSEISKFVEKLYLELI